jgi:hypothetical protein
MQNIINLFHRPIFTTVLKYIMKIEKHKSHYELNQINKINYKND